MDSKGPCPSTPVSGTPTAMPLTVKRLGSVGRMAGLEVERVRVSHVAEPMMRNEPSPGWADFEITSEEER